MNRRSSANAFRAAGGPRTEPAPTVSDEARGMWLGLLGVVCLAVTLPMTRLATGTAHAPPPSRWFLTMGFSAAAVVVVAVFAGRRAANAP